MFFFLCLWLAPPPLPSLISLRFFYFRFVFNLPQLVKLENVRRLTKIFFVSVFIFSSVYFSLFKETKPSFIIIMWRFERLKKLIFNKFFSLTFNLSLDWHSKSLFIFYLDPLRGVYTTRKKGFFIVFEKRIEFKNCVFRTASGICWRQWINSQW